MVHTSVPVMLMRLRTLAATLLLSLITTAQALPVIQQWQTGNGAQVYFVAAPELPMADIRIAFDAGSARDGQHWGLAGMTSGMLGEGVDDGTTRLDSDAIAERFDAIGADFSTGADRDMASLSLRSLTREPLFDQALETLALVLNAPNFPAADFERLRKQSLIGLRYEEQSPATLASKAFYRALYGDHPYAHPGNGTAETIAALEREALLAFYRRYYVARNAVVAIVGDLNRQQAEAVAERLVGRLPAGAPPAPLPQVAPLTEAQRISRNHPSKQTHILVGQPGNYRGDPDYFPLYVGNHVLGGSGLNSRIIDEIREQRGLAYSAYSYFSPLRVHGPFTLGLQTKNSSRDEALKVLQETLQRFVAEGPSEEELTASKANITGGFPLNIDSNKDILGYLMMIGFYQQPLDYLESFTTQVEAVTRAQIRDAFQRRIDASKMVTVTVGGE